MTPTVTYTWNSSLAHNFHIITLKFYAYQLYLFYNTLIIPIRARQYLDYSGGLVFLCSKKLPEDGTLVTKYVGV